jgi:cytochrome c biogenesis protein CcdA
MVVETSVLVSAGAGLASFLSPCILPILPGTAVASKELYADH